MNFEVQYRIMTTYAIFTLQQERKIGTLDPTEAARSGDMNKITYMTIGIIVSLIPSVSIAQLPTPSVSSYPLPSASTVQPSIKRVIGRIKNTSVSGQITNIIGNIILVSPVLNKKGMGASDSQTVISIDITNAQIIKNNRKNLEQNVLAVGDKVIIKAQISPDGQYVAQHVTVAGMRSTGISKKSISVIKSKKATQKPHIPTVLKKQQKSNPIPAKSP